MIHNNFTLFATCSDSDTQFHHFHCPLLSCRPTPQGTTPTLTTLPLAPPDPPPTTQTIDVAATTPGHHHGLTTTITEEEEIEIEEADGQTEEETTLPPPPSLPSTALTIPPDLLHTLIVEAMDHGDLDLMQIPTTPLVILPTIIITIITTMLGRRDVVPLAMVES